MNDRYKELAREAGLLVHNPEGVPTKLEKFAELIVKECIELNKQELSFNAFEQLLNRYQEHFETKPKMRRTTREEKISRPGIYEVPSE